jgi:hypothetical protein
MRVFLAAGGVYGFVDFACGWPGIAVLAGLAETMAQITGECPNCPDVPVSAFLLALAESARPMWPQTYTTSLSVDRVKRYAAQLQSVTRSRWPFAPDR